jgi:SAM-dependent methyltransferase
MTKLYDPEYDAKLLRGDEDPRPWDIIAEIRKRLFPEATLVDVGCGTASKTLPLAREIYQMFGVEPSAAMLAQARANVKAAKLTNTTIVKGSADSIPLVDEMADVVVSLLAPDNPGEFFRILKPGGWLIMEKLGEQDKHRLKEFFGRDYQGWRGQLYDWMPGERLRSCREHYEVDFDIHVLNEGWWNTYYTREGLELLLEQTSVIRGFDAQADQATLDLVEAELSAPRGILLPQHRILIVAQKPLDPS